MAKEKIAVYDINNLSKDHFQQHELLVERFGPYLARHPKSLHHPHRHSFYQLVLFTKGAGTHTIDFSTYPVKPCQIYFMIPGQVHSWQFEGDTDGFIINFSDALFRSFLVDADYLESFHFFSGVNDEGVCQLPQETYTKVVRLFEEMLDDRTEERTNDVEMTRLLLMQLFVLVERTTAGSVKNEAIQHKQILLKNFRQLIEQQYREKRLPKAYADLLFVTPNYLNAMCRELVGKTAGELIRDRVLLEAKRLLTKAVGMTVSEVSLDLNFQDNSYFNRFFKKYAGMTPDEFRKKF